jgi:CTP synthase
VYQLPGLFYEKGLLKRIVELSSLDDTRYMLSSPSATPSTMKAAEWVDIAKQITAEKPLMSVAILTSRSQPMDSYKSVQDALFHAALAKGYSLDLHMAYVDSYKLSNVNHFGDSIYSGVVAVGEYDDNEQQPLVEAIKLIHDSKLPFIGIETGMQAMVTEHATNTMNKTNVIIERETGVIGQQRMKAMAQNMARIYGEPVASARFKHHAEVDKSIVAQLGASLMVTALTEDDEVAAVEWADSFGVGVQFHPEFESTLRSPNPLFLSFIDAVSKV